MMAAIEEDATEKVERGWTSNAIKSVGKAADSNCRILALK